MTQPHKRTVKLYLYAFTTLILYFINIRKNKRFYSTNTCATFVARGSEHHVTNIKITRRNWQCCAPVAGQQTKAYLTALFRVLLLCGQPSRFVTKYGHTHSSHPHHLYTDMCHNFKTLFRHYFKVKSMSVYMPQPEVA